MCGPLDIARWLWRFEKEYCYGKLVRGRNFTGCKLDIYPLHEDSVDGVTVSKDFLELQLTMPVPFGVDAESKFYNMVRSASAGDPAYVYVLLSAERLEGLIRGDDSCAIRDEEWIWEDEDLP